MELFANHGVAFCRRAIQRAVAIASEFGPGKRSDQSLNDPQQVEELLKERNLGLAHNDSGDVSNFKMEFSED